MAFLKLQQGIIYGPVSSRRLGQSLGINLMPTGYKLCPFNCVYCHYGLTDRLTNQSVKGEFPTPEDVYEALSECLEQSSRLGRNLDYVTFSGNGEPTVHPQFYEIVKLVKNLRDNLYPTAKVALLSNSTMIGRKEVREAIEMVELPIMKLDAGTDELYKRVNRPMGGIDLSDIVAGLRELTGITTQTVFMKGSVDNVAHSAVSAWMDLLSKVRPRLAQIYTVDRWPADPCLEKVPRDRMEEIATLVGERTGLHVEVF